jgi:hypothetical protein
MLSLIERSDCSSWCLGDLLFCGTVLSHFASQNES